MGEAEIIREFLVESHENLDRLDEELVSLEGSPRNWEVLASIFRTIHTIKGSAGFLAFTQLERVADTGENLLEQLRDGLLDLTPTITTALLAMLDAVREMLAEIENSGSEGERDDRELISMLTDLLNTKNVPGTTHNIGEILVGKGITTRREVEEAIEQQNVGDPRHLGEILVEKGAIKPQDIVEALQTQQQVRMQGPSESTIRVDVEQLDRLMISVRELVLLRNQLVRHTNSRDHDEPVRASHRLTQLTDKLEADVKKMRVQPIGTVWCRFPRTARELALRCGKQVRVEMDGQDTELDRIVLEAIKAPLTHLVRNAVDHGIETRQVREAAGKETEGLLVLRAFHQGGHVNIEISDDGAGLDFDRIRYKAIEKKLITPEQAGRMSEREITDLIFLPGFSTAAIVTNVSGRGVGMDVVKTNIERIGGTVELQSAAGRGCIVRMKVPPTLKIGSKSEVSQRDTKHAIAKSVDAEKSATAEASDRLKAAQARGRMPASLRGLVAQIKNRDAIRRGDRAVLPTSAL